MNKKELVEKFQNAGITSFYHQVEKLELLLGVLNVSNHHGVAKKLLKKYQSIEDIIKAENDEEYKDIILKIRIVSELNKTFFIDGLVREGCELPSKVATLQYIKNIVPHLKNEIGYINRENFYVIYMDSANKVIKTDVLFKGTIDRSAVYPREIAEGILECEFSHMGKNPQNLVSSVLKFKAKSVIFAHNHPSGNIKPSRNDIEVTQSLKASLGMFDIRLLDHLIVTKDSYYSFLEEGLLE